ncbi:MAG: 2-hydroxyacyl-CoA dehydratase family protein [Thermodesulfobacteriota bacterium]
MKAYLESIVAFTETKLEQKPTGWHRLINELASTFSNAFDENAKVVWVSSYAFPMELLWAFDVAPFDFEIACNIIPPAISGNGSSIMVTAENQGYARDICSFYRLALGAHFQGMVPKGDLFLTSSYYCNGKAKTNETVARAQGKESILFDVPNEISRSSIDYVSSQLRGIASRLETVTGNRLDRDRLRESIRRSNTARASFEQVNELMKAKPSPWDGTKACFLGIAGSLFWGSPIRHEINVMLIHEMESRIQAGKAFPESYRILWFPWVPVQQTNIFTTLKEHQVSVVTAESARVYWPEIDESNPFEGLALKALNDPHVGSSQRRVKAIVGLAKDYEVDGAIHFSSVACRHENGSFSLIRDALRDEGLPVLNLEADMTDERNYSAEKTMTNMLSFFEILRNSSARGRH